MSKPAPTAEAPRAKRKSTPAQAAASRANGSLSRGPITIEGKSASSKNAIRHGLSASIHTVLDVESSAEYRCVYDAWVDDLRPMTKAELRLVEKLSNIDWRLERLVMMETALLEIGLNNHQNEAHAHWKEIDEMGLLAEAWQGASDLSHGLDLLRRYLATLQNQFNAMLKNFRNLEQARLDPSRIRDSAFLPPYQRPDVFGNPADRPSEQAPLQNEPGSAQPLFQESPAPETHSPVPRITNEEEHKQQPPPPSNPLTLARPLRTSAPLRGPRPAPDPR
ncbi:MAG TPA: hypothetical protein VGL53_15675 [Bryobacteraceae bacterium]|jgi:hypothetical protein